MARYDDLLKEAEELGIPTKGSGIYKPRREAWVEVQISEWELYRRIKEEKRHRREHNLWIVALVSAAISVLAMAAAWVAVLYHH